mmetsp:Transcript_13957/g.36941  ORF Transcript_13957/g.36941 Transcript_13957/m.36941 type:complete len:368 (-) Transcript_13957:1592-2695(-)
MLQRRLQGVVLGHRTDPVAALMPPHVVHDGLQHAELPFHEGLLLYARRGHVEYLGEAPGLLPAHVLGGDGPLVLCVVKEDHGRDRAPQVHHRHGRVVVRAVVKVRRDHVDDARHGLAPERVELQRPAPRLRRRVDVLVSLAEESVVHEVERQGRWALTVHGLLRGRRLVLQDVAAVGLPAHGRLDLGVLLREAVVPSGHARVDADQRPGVVLAQQACDLAQATGDRLLPAPGVLHDVLQGGHEHGLGPAHGDHLAEGLDEARGELVGELARGPALLGGELAGPQDVQDADAALPVDPHRGDGHGEEDPQRAHRRCAPQVPDLGLLRRGSDRARGASAEVGGHRVVEQPIVEEHAADGRGQCDVFSVF